MIRQKKQGQLIVVSGPSGAGKDTIVSKVIENKETDINCKKDVDDVEKESLVVKIGKVYAKEGERENSSACVINSASVEFSRKYIIEIDLFIGIGLSYLVYNDLTEFIVLYATLAPIVYKNDLVCILYFVLVEIYLLLKRI